MASWNSGAWGKKTYQCERKQKLKWWDIPPHTLPYMSSFTIVGIILQNIFNEWTQDIYKAQTMENYSNIYLNRFPRGYNIKQWSWFR
jgi:hypothetical protein